MAAQGLEPLPGYVAADESRHSPLAKKFPLELLPRKNDNYMNSTFARLACPPGDGGSASGVLEMHPEDAAARGIVDGDAVEVFNERGKIPLRAKVGATYLPEWSLPV